MFSFISSTMYEFPWNSGTVAPVKSSTPSVEKAQARVNLGLVSVTTQRRCRSKDIPPRKSFPPEEIYGSYDSKSLPPRKDFLGKIFPPGEKRFTGLKCPVKVFPGEDFY